MLNLTIPHWVKWFPRTRFFKKTKMEIFVPFAKYISGKFHQVAPLASLELVKIWPDGRTCIGSNFGHQIAPLTFVKN